MKNTSLSRKDIDLYQTSGDESVRHEIEKKSLGSDFDSDALDGWSSVSATTTVMQEIDKNFIRKHPNYLKIGLSFLGLTLLLSIFLFPVQKEKNLQRSQLPQKSAPIHNKTIDRTDLILPAHIEKLNSIPKKLQIAPQTIHQQFKQMAETNTTTLKPEQEIIESLQKHELKTTENSKTIKKGFLAKEIYLNDLKLVDYREYRSKPVVPVKQIILTGTTAEKESNSAQTEFMEERIVDIAYIEYIDKTTALFNKGNYKKALSRLETILETYPDDINGNFYAGLCYFNLNQAQKAIACFKNCLNSDYLNFNEEAEWYLAKSYEQNGNKKDAEELFQKIKNKGGYYANQSR